MNPIAAPVQVRLLGRFDLTIGGRRVTSAAWPTRRAAELVQLLALAPGHTLTRDEVIEALWPHLDVEAGAANLRKAAHHARKATGSPDAVVLRRGTVELFRGTTLSTDVEQFVRAADAVLARSDVGGWSEAAARYGGDLLPESRYEEWTQLPRRQLRTRHLDLLRRGAQWERVVDIEPADEPAHRELMRAAMTAGNRHAAVQWYGRLRSSLRDELGLLPSPETEALYDECVEGLAPVEPAFVGRHVELARATAVLRQGPDTPVAAILIRGPAGIGKSALCRRITELARREGWLSLGTEADAGSGAYEPVAALIEDLIGRDRALLDRLSGATRSVLAQLTSLAAPAGRSRGSLTRHHVVGAVRRLVTAASDTAGVVVTLDDAHLADEATLDAVFRLAGPDAPGILVVLAYRADRAPESLVRQARRGRRAGRTLEFDLDPLPPDDAASLVVATAGVPTDRAEVDEIIDAAGGNPFFVVELARLFDGTGAPASVSDAVVGRFVDLNDGHAAMLRRLAVASDDFDPALVAALTGASESEAFSLLDAALSAGVLVVSGARYRFRHQLVRQALVEQMAPHQRIAVHRDAARRLAASGASPALVARHWLDGDRPDEATEWLIDAARRAIELGAFADALGHLAPALEQVPDHAEGLCLRAEALDALGRGGAPAAYAAAAAAVGDSTADDLRAKQALAQLKLGDFSGAVRTVNDVAPTTLDGRLARALTLSGAAAVGFADPGLATRQAAESRRLALEIGDPGAVVSAAWAQALAAHARGDLRDSVCADVRETANLPELAIQIFDGQLCVTQRLLYGAAPYADVIAFADALAAEAERLHAIRGQAFAVTLRGEAELLAGRLRDAEHDLAWGGRLHRSIAAATGEAHTLQRRAELALHERRRPDAVALLREAREVAAESGVGFHLYDRIYGTAIAAAPDPGAALAVVEEAEEAIRGPVETCPGCRITFAVPAAIAAARAGDLERAALHAEAAEMLADVVMRLPAWYAARDEVKGHLALACGDTDEAHERFLVAAHGFREAGQPLDEARCRALVVVSAGAGSGRSSATPSPGPA